MARSARSEAKNGTSLLTLLLNLIWDVTPPDRSHPVVILERQR